MARPVHLVEWRSLSGRIEGFKAALEVYLKARSLPQIGTSIGGDDLTNALYNLIGDIERFATTHRNHLSDTVVKVFYPFNSIMRVQLSDALNGGSLFRPDALLRIGISVISLRAEVDYLLSGQDTYLRSLTENSFRHLQRLITVDTDFRLKWQRAMQEGEPSCERLGAIHLLWHGLFAFKAGASGEQTDLVFSEPVEADDAPGASGLVLTEWKVLRRGEDAGQKAEQARLQAARYNMGVLNGVELKGTRYLVLVSDYQIQRPRDHVEADVSYRCINVAVSPESPSQSARRLSRGSADPC